MNKNFYNQRGVSLILVFFMMIIITSAVLFMGVFLRSRIITIRNTSSSIVSFYAADTGVEKVLYYDRKVRTEEDVRGLCLMCDSAGQSCPSVSIGDGLDCQCETSVPGPNNPNGCDVDTCNDCTVSFETSFDGKRYKVVSQVFPEGGTDPDLEIKSTGIFSGIGRAINVLIMLP